MEAIKERIAREEDDEIFWERACVCMQEEESEEELRSLFKDINKVSVLSSLLKIILQLHTPTGTHTYHPPNVEGD